MSCAHFSVHYCGSTRRRSRVAAKCAALLLGIFVIFLSPCFAMSQLPANVGSASRRTFYRRPLPATCTAFSSKQGRLQFESALTTKGLRSFFPLMEQFTTQAEPAYCGVSTLVIALNALSVDPRRTWKGAWRWYEERMLNCCVDLEAMKTTGITLKQYACLARCQGLSVDARWADQFSLDQFREAVHLACVESDDGNDESFPKLNAVLTVSYSRKVLGQTGSGHFSPVAAYDVVSDSVLVLDTARFKYGAHWVKLPLLYDAMLPIDPETGRSRGFVLLSHDGDSAEDPQSQQLPISILFRSRMSQSPLRQEFKDFLAAKRLDKRGLLWDDVVEYWTKGGKNPNHVLEILEPQLSPMNVDEEAMVEAVRTLLDDLIPANPTFPIVHEDCRSNLARTLCIRPEEAMFVIYLSCLDDKTRRHVVYGGEDEVLDLPRQQLLAEAELVGYAIETSDTDVTNDM